MPQFWQLTPNLTKIISTNEIMVRNFHPINSAPSNSKTEVTLCSRYLLIIISTYFSVPNGRVGRNKRAGGKILRKH